ncbi:hypothetical protein [Pseudoxanthomonas sp. PXM04]|uniref:hypothetical protein n=1 Tax=Pseudoxanthomonas sp. PXM04 TaxID=2769297 RepID=UPI00177D9001|nr:hypothetical protein [Pseudoxanthomonas sp. PXM04]MBD9377928.1 hypothetical protein [Pseudoxanthomonas sp. PXM04]
MTVPVPVVEKYMACTAFDEGSGQCAAVVWVDKPSSIPKLSAEHGLMLSGAIVVIWFAAAVFGPVLRKSASTRY